MKVALKVFLLGFFFAPLGDMVHVSTHTTWYPSGYAFYFMGIPYLLISIAPSAELESDH